MAVRELDRDSKARDQRRRQEALQCDGCHHEKGEIAETDQDRLRSERLRRARHGRAGPTHPPLGRQWRGLRDEIECQ